MAETSAIPPFPDDSDLITHLSVGSQRFMALVTSSGLCYRWHEKRHDWLLLPSSNASTVAVAIGADGDLWMLNQENEIHHFNS